ncbi:MAG: hypothetical protein QW165_03505 [Candidatus Woesearchaeota archaeon]
MAVQRGFSTIIFSILGIFILVVAVVIIVNVMSGEPPVKDIIHKSIELRKATDPIDRANLISALDDAVSASENSEVKDQWQRMTKCLTTACPDEAYLDMVLVTVAAFEKDVHESALLINIVATAKYWGDPEHLLDFSKALSAASEQVKELENKKAGKAWDAVVQCNNACPEKNDLYFDVIAAVVK